MEPTKTDFNFEEHEHPALVNARRPDARVHHVRDHEPDVQHAGAEDERGVYIATIVMIGAAGVHHVILNHVSTKATRTDARVHNATDDEIAITVSTIKAAPTTSNRWGGGAKGGAKGGAEANRKPRKHREDAPGGGEQGEANRKHREDAPGGDEHGAANRKHREIILYVQQQRVVELGERGGPALQEPAHAALPAEEGSQPSGAVGSSCARRSGARPPPSRVPRYHLGAPAPAAASLARDEHVGATPVPRAKVMNSRRSAVLGWNNGIRTGIVINCKFTPAATASSMQLQVPSAFSHAV